MAFKCDSKYLAAIVVDNVDDWTLGTRFAVPLECLQELICQVRYSRAAFLFDYSLWWEIKLHNTGCRHGRR